MSLVTNGYFANSNTVVSETLLWLEDWLTGRTQKVVIDGESLDDAPVLSGVPQGTVLWALMFILYIIDISTDISSSIRLLADDCLLYRVVKGRRDASQLQCESALQVGTGLADGLQPHQVLCSLHHKEEEPLEVPYTINGVQLEHAVYVPVC